jgi:hypothetical protein
MIDVSDNLKILGEYKHQTSYMYELIEWDLAFLLIDQV